VGSNQLGTFLISKEKICNNGAIDFKFYMQDMGGIVGVAFRFKNL